MPRPYQTRPFLFAIHDGSSDSSGNLIIDHLALASEPIPSEQQATSSNNLKLNLHACDNDGHLAWMILRDSEHSTGILVESNLSFAPLLKELSTREAVQGGKVYCHAAHFRKLLPSLRPSLLRDFFSNCPKFFCQSEKHLHVNQFCLSKAAKLVVKEMHIDDLSLIHI